MSASLRQPSLLSAALALALSAQSGAALEFIATNTYTGATTVSAGTLKAGVASVANTSGAFGNNSAVTLANAAGVTLDLNTFNTQIGSLAGGGTLGGDGGLLRAGAVQRHPELDS